MAWDLDSGDRTDHFFLMTELATLRVRALSIGTLASVVSIMLNNEVLPLVDCVISSVGSAGSGTSDISSSSSSCEEASFSSTGEGAEAGFE